MVWKSWLVVGKVFIEIVYYHYEVLPGGVYMRKDIGNDKTIMDFDFQIVRSEPTHFHQSIEVIYILEGKTSITVENNTYEAESEDVLVVNANKKHSYQSSGDVLIGYFMINYQQLSDILNTNQIMFWCNSIVYKNAAYDELRLVMKQIFNQYFDKRGQGFIVLMSLYYKMIQILVEHFLVSCDDKRVNGEKSSEEDRLSKILHYVRSNYQKRLSLHELADYLYLSTPYLSKYIKRNLGMNFIDYVNNIRLFHAVDDLLYTDKPIISIALDNGFANAAAFNELFKKTYNEKPSEYRRKMHAESGDSRGEEKEQEKRKIDKRVNDYLENNVLVQQVNRSKEDSYKIFDVTKTRGYTQYWKKMINIGRAGDLLRSDMQEHILILKEEIGLEYVRFWDIFGEDMLMNETNETGKYNFDKLDKILDFLVEHKIRPYIEMGYKPKNLHSTLMKMVVTRDREIAFQSLQSFKRFLSAFVTHLTNRYGLEEIEKWYFEQWNGEDFSKGNVDEYFYSVFNALYEIIKKISPNIKVGGGGIGIQYGSGNLSRLVFLWGQQKHVPDFLTLYCYPYIIVDEDGSDYAKISKDRDFLKNQLEMASAVIQDSGLKNAKIHVSEWSSTVSNRNILNDSCYKGAYIMKSIIDCINMVDVLGYWVGSDIFSEYYDSTQLLFGGCGLLNRDGIKKPAFYAYHFLNNMGKYLIGSDGNSIVTTNGHNSFEIACHNYRHLNYKYYLKPEDELEIGKISQLFEDNESLCINYRLINIPKGRYKIKIYAVNADNGSVQEEWGRMGLNDHLTMQEVEYLKRICTPYIQIKEYDVKGNTLDFQVNMKAQEIQYIHITYLYQ
jgi:beta-xylosidase/AraC-like DNA-binding protein/mannose-6-phosphate isomerase-like protein (cupin superfamily)